MKEGGEVGQMKIEAISRYTAVGIALLQGFGITPLSTAHGSLLSPVLAGHRDHQSFTAGAPSHVAG
jgi:preprotein translocase subunit SecY